MATFVFAGKTVKAVHDFDSDPNAPFPTDLATATAYNTYEAAANDLLAFVLGHELQHAQGQCVVATPSWAERSGRFNELLGLQAAGRFCSKDLDPDELIADRCGLRVLEQMDGAMVAFKTAHWPAPLTENPALAILSVGRRISIDALSWIFSLGLGGRVPKAVHVKDPGADGLPTVAYEETPRPGYLYQPLRLYLYAALLHQQEQFNQHLVRLCDSTAQRFVLGLNLASVGCGGKGDADLRAAQRAFPKFFGELVPEGVKERWASGAWENADTDGTFACPSTSPAMKQPAFAPPKPPASLKMRFDKSSR